jgi:hypothetical protein
MKRKEDFWNLVDSDRPLPSTLKACETNFHADGERFYISSVTRRYILCRYSLPYYLEESTVKGFDHQHGQLLTKLQAKKTLLQDHLW